MEQARRLDARARRRRARWCSCCRTRPGRAGPAARWPTTWRRRTPAAPSPSCRPRPAAVIWSPCAFRAIPRSPPRRFVVGFRPAAGGRRRRASIICRARSWIAFATGVRDSNFAPGISGAMNTIFSRMGALYRILRRTFGVKVIPLFIAVFFGVRAHGGRRSRWRSTTCSSRGWPRRAPTARSCWSATRGPARRSCSASCRTRGSARGWSCS